MKQKCKTANCNNIVEAPNDPLLARLAFYCPACCERYSVEAKEQETKELIDSRVTAWRRICPIEFQATDAARLPKPSKAMEVLSWAYNSKGLLLHGKTGTGKSRCGWLLCERVFYSGKSVQILDALAGFEYAGIFEGGARAAKDWIDRRCNCGLIFFDDVFKAKLTDSFEAAVFAIIDYRMSHGLPVLATLNDTGGTLAARMSPDRGDALVRRLKEMCSVIQF